MIGHAGRYDQGARLHRTITQFNPETMRYLTDPLHLVVAKLNTVALCLGTAPLSQLARRRPIEPEHVVHVRGESVARASRVDHQHAPQRAAKSLRRAQPGGSATNNYCIPHILRHAPRMTELCNTCKQVCEFGKEYILDILQQVGPRLRAARQHRGWTLEDLASKAGISVSTLSRLESGKRQASLELLLPLTSQLGIRIDDLLASEHRDPRVRRPAVQRQGMVVAPLTREESEVRAFKISYQPGAPIPSNPKTHDGHEWLYVLSGRLRLRLGDTTHILTRGEAAEFDTRTPHTLSAEGTSPAEVISIFNSVGERLHLHSLDAEPG